MQVAGGRDSPWYLYAETNAGFGVGFFANANHMADLLVIALAFAAGIAAAGQSGNIQRNWALWTVLAALAVVLFVGLALTNSIAGWGLSVSVFFASSLLLVPRTSRWRRYLLALGLCVADRFCSRTVRQSDWRSPHWQTDGGVSSIAPTDPGDHSGGHWRLHAVRLGARLVPSKCTSLYESPGRGLRAIYVIHAHDDYAELALELGLARHSSCWLFLAWWAAQCLGRLAASA